MKKIQSELETPGTTKPSTTPAQPSTDPQEDNREISKEMPDIEHGGETTIPEVPEQGENKPPKNTFFIRLNSN